MGGGGTDRSRTSELLAESARGIIADLHLTRERARHLRAQSTLLRVEAQTQRRKRTTLLRDDA